MPGRTRGGKGGESGLLCEEGREAADLFRERGDGGGGYEDYISTRRDGYVIGLQPLLAEEAVESKLRRPSPCLDRAAYATDEKWEVLMELGRGKGVGVSPRRDLETWGIRRLAQVEETGETRADH